MRTGLILLFVIQSPNVISENHWVFDQDKNEISASADSPYVIRQPHSLTDFVNQQKWIQELAEIRLSIRQQQQLIERRYAEDDPEIEDKIRKNDPNCVRSKPLDLQTEHFMVTYPIDLIRSHSEKPRNTYE
ncbi:tetratricopeptide repeat domain 17 [Aphelenchoides avenae]|nr:tetratricopeptide repeat domain 17 [Aphelenchus avenae]